MRFLGPGFLVTVGFIDPGNWATNLAGGAEFGYELLWVITLSTLMLILIQNMAARLGIATGKSLAVNIREQFSKPVDVISYREKMNQFLKKRIDEEAVYV